VEVVASLSQGRTAAAQCDLFTHKSVSVIFEPPCTYLLAYLFHGTKSFLRSKPVLYQSRNSPHFMEPENSLAHAQVPATCPYPEPDQSSPHTFCNLEFLSLKFIFILWPCRLWCCFCWYHEA